MINFKIELWKIVKIFGKEFHIKIPNFMNPWKLAGRQIVFNNPPTKNELVTVEYRYK